ncbi:MAG: dienelactone hydrolase family protein [Bradyrhizobium sp.]|nr:MAG: dienelactone hydrolase family protein [Bradyrhizobium sp.]
MGEWIELKASDGFQLRAWKAEPQGKARGALVVVQEIFGVNAHIRWVADGFAADGYLAIAPAIFDRGEPGFDAEYNPESMARGSALSQAIGRDAMLLDVAAAAKAAKAGGKVGVVGYCLGGTLAWMAAANLEGVDAAVGYYGGGIIGLNALKPRVPTMLHFGEKDAHIPLDGVRAISAAHPDVPVYTYPTGGHAFNRYGNAAYDPASATLARSRTLEFFNAKLI